MTDTTYTKGSWQATLSESAELFAKSARNRKHASALLWDGAQTAITEWLPKVSDDVSGEVLYNDLLDVLGKSRKGDASKIRTVALAVDRHGLVTATYDNLSKAYAEAVRLTKTVQQQADEDEAADKVIEALAADAPKTATAPESAAKILLSKGIDGAVVAILDVLNGGEKNNEAAHRAFLRAVTQEIVARSQAAKAAEKPEPKKTTPKKAAKKAVVKDGAKKAKAAPVKKKPAKKAAAEPVEFAKAVPVKKATVKKAAPAEPTPAKKAAPVVTRPARKAPPVVRR